MKILYVCREFPYPADSGVKQRNWYILERLAQQHEVHLVCYGRPEQAQEPTVRQVCRAVRVIQPLPRPSGLLLYGRMLKGLLSTMPYGVAGRFDSGFKHQVAGLLAEGRFDLVFCDSLYHAQHLSGSLARLILNEHNIESVIIRRYAAVEPNILKQAYAWFEGRRMAWYEDRIWRQFDRIWMCSDVDRDEVLSRLPRAQVDVVPNGVAFPAQLPAGDPRPNTLIYTGLIGWRPQRGRGPVFRPPDLSPGQRTGEGGQLVGGRQRPPGPWSRPWPRPTRRSRSPGPFRRSPRMSKGPRW